MILMIVLAGSMFSGVFFGSGGMLATKSLLKSFGLSPWSVMAIILVVAFLLGFVLDLISIVLIVVPLAIPLVKTFGIDPLWFAVVMLVVLQTSYLTPPMAPSIFYLKAIAPPDDPAQAHVLGRHSLHRLPTFDADRRDLLPGTRDLASESHVRKLGWAVLKLRPGRAPLMTGLDEERSWSTRSATTASNQASSLNS